MTGKNISSTNPKINVSPLFMKKTNDNRPYLNVKIFNESVLALVDTGSNSTILGSKGYPLIHMLNLPIEYDDSVDVTTADGTCQQVLGYISAPISVNNVSHVSKIFIISSVTHSLILGMDFLKSFNIDVNFQTLSYKLLSSLCVLNTIHPISSLSSSQTAELQRVIDLFSNIAPEDQLGLTTLIEHHIDTKDAKPISQKQYPLSPAMQQHLNKEIDEMLKLKVIEPSNSPWCSPLWIVPKKSNEFRVCFDGRKLNKVTVSDSYPMPLIDHILNKLRDAKYLSSIDLRKAFFQVPLTISSRPKTAFAVYGRGLFQFRTMPFGLAGSPKTMARLMDRVIGPSLAPYCFVYLDDIIIATPTFELHIKTLEKVYDRLKMTNLTINLGKCTFCRS